MKLRYHRDNQWKQIQPDDEVKLRHHRDNQSRQIRLDDGIKRSTCLSKIRLDDEMRRQDSRGIRRREKRRNMA